MTVKELKEKLVGIDDDLEIYMSTDGHNIATHSKVGVGYATEDDAWTATEDEIQEIINDHYGYGPAPERVFVMRGS